MRRFSLSAHGCTSLLLVGALALLPIPAAAQPRRAAPQGGASGRPVIGINMDVSGGRDPESGGVSLRLSSAYVDAVTSAGGIPVVLPPALDEESIRRQVALCDGFVFVGGADINPERYGETSHPATRLFHPRREEYDFSLMGAALKSRKPILGVCAGCQELNVALGGSLIQDLPSETSSTIDHRPGSSRHEFAHEIAVEPNTRLSDLVGTTTLGVNSIHHQACEVLGRKLRIGAKAPDGTIEAIELPGRRFVVGVQWHPEALTSHPQHLRIYQGLVEAAKAQPKQEGRRRRAARR